MLAYVARQPILNSNEQAIGYELLFRDGHNNSYPGIDPNQATSQIISQNHLTLGLDAICADKLAFINFHEESLLEQLPRSLSNQSTIVEILEDVPVTEALLNSCKMLQENGYKLALDDHDFQPQWSDLYPYISIIKVDITQHTFDLLREYCEVFKEFHPHITLLAERVENKQEFNELKEMGFELFQGFYFAKPEIIEHHTLSADKTKLLQLISILSEPDFAFDEVAQLIETDPTLSYKLLRFISSSYFTTSSKITSVKNALTYLGGEEIRKFVSLIALSNLNQNVSSEVYTMALTRAKLCEQLTLQKYPGADSAKAYLTGLLSMIAVILQIPTAQVLEKLPIDDDMKMALLEQSGELGNLLNLCNNFELGHWQQLDQTAFELGLTSEQVSDAYQLALSWLHSHPISL